MQEAPLSHWLEQLSARQPTPGGGAVAALAAALSAALASMVSAYTTGEKWAAVEENMQAINRHAAKLREQAIALMHDDENAFAAVGAAYALPKDSATKKAARQQAIQDALVGAAQPPRQIVAMIDELLPLLQNLADDGNPNVISDVAVAASMATAALESAIVNVDINRILIHDEAVANGLEQSVIQATRLATETSALTKKVIERLRSA